MTGRIRNLRASVNILKELYFMTKNIDRKSDELVIMKCYGPTCCIVRKIHQNRALLGTSWRTEISSGLIHYQVKSTLSTMWPSLKWAKLIMRPFQKVILLYLIEQNNAGRNFFDWWRNVLSADNLSHFTVSKGTNISWGEENFVRHCLVR